MRRKARFFQAFGSAAMAGLLLFAGPAWAADNGAEDIELIPAPPGAAAAASPTAKAVAPAGDLKLPADLPLERKVRGGISAPGFLTAIAGNRSVLLSWYPSEGPQPISGYHVYRGLSPDSISPLPVDREPVSGTNYSDSDASSLQGPLNRTTYYYRVRAFDQDGRLSPYSDTVEARPSGPLLPPGKLDAFGANGRILLAWTPPISTGESDLAGYRLLRGEKSGELSLYKDLGPDAVQFNDVGLSNGKAWFYAVQSVDAQGHVSPPSPEVRGVAFRSVGAPQGLSALGVGDEAVRLKWEPPAEAGTFKVKGYNIYRATAGMQPDLASPPINKALIPATRKRFEDGPDDSVTAPKKGTDYDYVIVAVDAEGNPSPPSKGSVAGPVASLTKLETGEIEITSGNTLQIRGRKTIDLSQTWLAAGQSLSNPGFQLDQQLQVQLTGKVGRKIKVDVDYDDKQAGSQQQKISVVYTGDQQEVFKEFAFGDILMDLNSARTRYSGYNKSLFGAKLKIESPDSKLRITAVGAQTKGISETKRIVGGYEQARTGNTLGEDKQDFTFIPYKYYYLSREKEIVEGGDFIEAGSVDIWFHQPASTIYTNGRVEVNDKFGGKFYFVRLVPNVDYTVDSLSGLVTFNRQITPDSAIAVAYRVHRTSGAIESVGYDALGQFDFSTANLDSDVSTGRTSNSKKLIQWGTAYPAQYDSHMSMQYYRLNNRDILNPQLDPDFKLIVYTANSVPIYQVSPSSNFSDVVIVDQKSGIMHFRVPFPFSASTSSPGDLQMDPTFTKVDQVFAPNQQDAYNRTYTSKFHVHIEYKYKVASYNLRFGIIRGSEVILLDGRRLTRDVDYFLDYDTGSLVFSNPDLIKENSVVDATYEYLPFGGQFTSTIWGTRGEYDVTKDISVGSTFLWNSADTPTEVPDVRSAPYSLKILDGDIQAAVPQALLDGITAKLPLLPDRGGLIKIKASGEMARSWYQPNTFGKNNESGVAMIDSFEAVDNIVSASTDRASWEPSSIPLRYNGDPGLLPADRRFSRFVTVEEDAHNRQELLDNNESPRKNMLQLNWLGFDNPNRWDSFIYGFGQSAPDAIKGASYLEMWVKSDSPVQVHVDVGVIDEDATDNGLTDYESNTGGLTAEQDVGILNPATGSPYPSPESRPDLYADTNYWGRDNKRIDTEDINGDGQASPINNYYAYSALVDPANNDPNSNNFQLIRIPLTAASIVGSNLSVVPGNLNYFAQVQAVRVWISGAGAQGGQLLIESLQFKGNKWQVQADPNITTLGGVSVTADTNRFQVSAVNSANQGTGAPFTYVPNTSFYTTTSTNNSTDREQSLQLEYALTGLEQSDGRPYYQARRLLSNGQDVDAEVYKNLRLDLYKPHRTLPGERLLVRLGSDDLNYFEYAIPLDSEGVGTWNSITLALDGSDGKRTVLGKPYLRQVRYVAVAVHTLNDSLSNEPGLVDHKELLWLNNLRLTDAIAREGGAQRASVAYDLMDGKLTVSHDLSERDSDFVMMDQQAVAPQRHEIAQVIDAHLNAIAGMPVAAHYEDRQLSTEPLHKDDPLYSRIFVDPDESDQKTSASIGFTKVPGLTANASASLEHSRQIFLPAYVNSQLELQQTDINPNSNRDNLRLAQDATYHFPAKWWGVGNDEMRAEYIYEETKVLFDKEAVNVDSAFRDVDRQTRTYKGRYSGSYKAGSWLTMTPSYAFTVVEAEGNIPIPTVLNGQAYYDLGPEHRSDGWIPQSRVINPSMLLQFSDLGILKAPKATYNFTQTRDFVRNEMRTPGSLDMSTSLVFTSLGGAWQKIPSIDFTQSFGVDSTINNDIRIRSAERSTALAAWLQGDGEFQNRYRGVPDQSIPSLALAEQMNPFQSVWWIRVDEPTLGENVADPLNIENIAATASRRSVTGFTTHFDLPLLPNWTGTFTPRLNFRDERTMLAPEQVTRRYQTTVGTGLEFKEPHVPFWRTLKPSALTLDYSYSSSDNRVVQIVDEIPNATSISHTFTGTLPMRPGERLSVTLGLRGTLTGDDTFTVGQSDPTSRRSSWELDPSLKVVYFLNLDKPWKLPDMWPFNGREIRIKQSFRLDNDLLATLRRDTQTLISNQPQNSGSDLYTLRNQIGWDLLENVKTNLTLEQQVYNNANPDQTINQNTFYYTIQVKVGLEATF